MAMFTSCHDNLELNPISEITPDTFFNDLDEVEIAVNGMYDVFALSYHQFYIKITDHGSHVGTNNLANYNQNLYATYTFNSADRDILTLWQSAYQGIYRSNVIIVKMSFVQSTDFLRNIGVSSLVRLEQKGLVKKKLYEMEDQTDQIFSNVCLEDFKISTDFCQEKFLLVVLGKSEL